MVIVIVVVIVMSWSVIEKWFLGSESVFGQFKYRMYLLMVDRWSLARYDPSVGELYDAGVSVMAEKKRRQIDVSETIPTEKAAERDQRTRVVYDIDI